MAKRILSMTVVLTLLLSLLAMPGVFAAKIETRNLVEEDYEDGSSSYPDSSKVTIVSDPAEDGTHGKVGLVDVGGPYNISCTNDYKVIFDTDFYFTNNTSDYEFSIRLRGTDAGGTTKERNKLFDVSGGKVTGIGITDVPLEANTWYHLELTFDYHNEKATTVVTDPSGEAVINAVNKNLSLGDIAKGKVTHFRIYVGEQVYFDNVLFNEEVVWTELESITDGDGGSRVEYTTNTLRVNMTKALVKPAVTDVKIVRDLDETEIPVTETAIDGKSLVLTLGKPLQSSSSYTLTLAETVKMKYGSIELGEPIVANFNTTSRLLDIKRANFTPGENNQVTCSARVYNDNDGTVSAIILFVAYDATGRIAECAYSPITFTDPDEKNCASVTLTMPEGGCIKVMGISDFATATPVNNNIYTYK